MIIMGKSIANSDVLATLPSAMQWHIVMLADEAHVLTYLAAFPCELVVTDPFLQGAEAVALYQRIRTINPHTKVILLTADHDPATVAQALREHAFSYFAAPFEEKELLAQMIAAMETSEWEDGIEVITASATWVALNARCRKLTVLRLLRFFDELEMDLPKKEREDLNYAFREILLNAIEHGGKGDPQQRVRVDFVRTSQVLLYYLRDPGSGFLFEQLPHAALTNPADSPLEHFLYRTRKGMRVGGFGILIAKNLVDDLIYNERGNEVILLKYLAKKTS